MESNFAVQTAFGIDNLPQVRQIRQEVFMEEQGFQNEFDATDETALHLLVLAGEEPAATGRAFSQDGGKVWHIGRVCVRKAFRGRELGRMVMEGLEKAVAGQGGEKVVLSAQVQARGFYEKLGYTAHGPEYLDEHCPHVEMEKRL